MKNHPHNMKSNRPSKCRKPCWHICLKPSPEQLCHSWLSEIAQTSKSEHADPLRHHTINSIMLRRASAAAITICMVFIMRGVSGQVLLMTMQLNTKGIPIVSMCLASSSVMIALICSLTGATLQNQLPSSQHPSQKRRADTPND